MHMTYLLYPPWTKVGRDFVRFTLQSSHEPTALEHSATGYIAVLRGIKRRQKAEEAVMQCPFPNNKVKSPMVYSPLLYFSVSEKQNPWH